MEVVLSSLIGAITASILTAYFLGRKERATLIEKWMNNIRDEVSRLLGIADEQVVQNSKTYRDIETSKYKILLLLKKDEQDPDQDILRASVETLCKKAVNGSGPIVDPKYIEAKEQVFDQTRNILTQHWDKVNYLLKYSFVHITCHFIRRFRDKRVELMWFKRNGHFAKNDFPESEVPHECSKNQTKLHQRIQSRCCWPGG